MNPMIMHINYGEMTYDSYGDRTVDDICKIAATLGFDGVEFRAKPPRELMSAGVEAYVRQIGEAKKKYGLSQILFGVSVANCINEDPALREQSIKGALEMAKLAQEYCGTELCNTFGGLIRNTDPKADPYDYSQHGSAIATKEQWEDTVESFQKLGEGLTRLGMKFAFETHMNYIHDLPAPTAKLVKAIDSAAIGVNMDFGNTVYFKEHPTLEEAIELYGEKLFYTHLKNSSAIPGSPYRMACGLGDGDINHRAYWKKLKSMNYQGPVGIEAPRTGDRIWFAQQDLGYFRNVVESDL